GVGRARGARPCAPVEKQWGIEMPLPQLIDAVHEVRSNSIGPYLDHNRQRICEHCPMLHSSDCPCPMDYLAVLVVQAVETVDERRGPRLALGLPGLPWPEEDEANLDTISPAYAGATGKWGGWDWPPRFRCPSPKPKGGDGGGRGRNGACRLWHRRRRGLAGRGQLAGEGGEGRQGRGGTGDPGRRGGLHRPVGFGPGARPACPHHRVFRWPSGPWQALPLATAPPGG